MKTNLMNKIKAVKLSTRKNAPKIYLYLGIAGTIVSTGLACYATTKISGIKEDMKNQIQEVDDLVEKNREDYTVEDGEKDKKIIKGRACANIAVSYMPSILLGIASYGCIVKSHNILTKRNIAMASAYATLQASFSDYRTKVKAEIGEEKEAELYYGIEDEKPGNKKSKGDKIASKSGMPSPYAVYYDATTSSQFDEKSDGYNEIFIDSVQAHACNVFRANGIVFLNDIYKALGLPITEAGQIVGWVYNKDNPNTDNYIEISRKNVYRIDENGDKFKSMILDFNVDGDVLDSLA